MDDRRIKELEAEVARLRTKNEQLEKELREERRLHNETAAAAARFRKAVATGALSA